MGESLKGWARRLAKPQRQAGALTSDVLGVIRLTAGKPRLPSVAVRRRCNRLPPAPASTWRGWPCSPTPDCATARPPRSPGATLNAGPTAAAAFTVIRSKTDVEAQGAVVAITPTAMKALDAIRPVGVAREEKVFGLSASQIARRVKAVAKAAGLPDWESFSGHSGRVGMAQNSAPTHEIDRQGRWKQGGGMVGRYTRGESAGSALRYL